MSRLRDVFFGERVQKPIPLFDSNPNVQAVLREYADALKATSHDSDLYKNRENLVAIRKEELRKLQQNDVAHYIKEVRELIEMVKDLNTLRDIAADPVNDPRHNASRRPSDEVLDSFAPKIRHEMVEAINHYIPKAKQNHKSMERFAYGLLSQTGADFQEYREDRKAVANSVKASIDHILDPTNPKKLEKLIDANNGMRERAGFHATFWNKWGGLAAVGTAFYFTGVALVLVGALTLNLPLTAIALGVIMTGAAMMTTGGVVSLVKNAKKYEARDDIRLLTDCAKKVVERMPQGKEAKQHDEVEMNEFRPRSQGH